MSSTLATIENSYAIGNVIALNLNSQLGDLIVYKTGDSTTDSYSVGDVIAPVGSTSIGGLIGNSYGTSHTVMNSYSVNESGLVNNSNFNVFNSYYNSANTTVSLGNSLSLDDMKIQSNFVGFDFENTWIMGTSDYPYPILR